MHKIKRIILATAIVLFSSMAFAEEPAKKPDKDLLHGWAAQDDYLEKKREKEGKKGIRISDFVPYAVGAGMVTVLGVMIYLRHKEKKQSD